MIPLVGHVNELSRVRGLLEAEAKQVEEGARRPASTTSSAP